MTETQNTVFAAAVTRAALALPARAKRGNGRLVPFSVLKASAFAHSDWEVFECMIKAAVRAGCLRMLTYKGSQWLLLDAQPRPEAAS
jgi:hypothetical protein